MRAYKKAGENAIKKDKVETKLCSSSEFKTGKNPLKRIDIILYRIVNLQQTSEKLQSIKKLLTTSS